ncbi:hypothetical protein R1sor_009460 [Riccia sorocarpa]|uniref:Uncharacterized protein n=1 Tax=Riccia sorocarpa TaxID=122646 RepID=A0ABD3HYJ1_9MARC
MAPAFVGKRLPSIRLMEEELSDQYASAGHSFLKKIAQFVPYTFKDMADVDLVEYSALSSMNMLKYVTGVQRLCIPEDVFWYALWNTDADGDRLLIKGTSGATCIVGWHKVSVAFGASHGEAEEFRAIKINNKNFVQYRPGEYLPETVETNAGRKLVNGQPYEEISYYKEAAPYGPTYYIMSVIDELFWCNGCTTRFTTLMVYAYMRSVHGFQTNWSKVILHSLKTEISFLQKRARSTDNSKVMPIVWAPVFMRLLYAFRATIFSGTQLASPETWVSWVHMSKDGDIDLKNLVAKFPDPIDDLKLMRESCKLTDKIPIAEPVNGGPVEGNSGALVPSRTPSKLPARKRARKNQVVADDNNDVPAGRNVRNRYTERRQPVAAADPGPSTPASSPGSSPTDDDSSGGCVLLDPIFSDFAKKMGPMLVDVVSTRLQGTFGPLLVDANAGQSLKKQLAELTTKLEESQRGRTGLIGQVEALKADLITCKEKATSELAASNGLRTQKELQYMKQESANAKTSIAKLETDLKLARKDVATWSAGEENLKAQIKSLTGQMEALKADSAAKVAQLQQQYAVLQEQLQTEKLAVDRFKNAFNTEMQKNSDLDEQVVTLMAEIDSHKFSAERAEKAQSALHSELAKVKAELCMLQISAK